MKTTNSYLKQIPYMLTYSRLLMAIYYIFVAIFESLQDPLVIGIILIAAIVTDIFDGVLARKFKSDTVHLRQLDSKIDTIFWLSLTYVLLVTQSAFMKEHAIKLIILIALEIAVQLFGYFKFNTAIAFHTYAAKAWALLLTATVLVLLSGYRAEIIFRIMFVWGIIVQAEVIYILLKLKTFRVDIKSFLKLK